MMPLWLAAVLLLLTIAGIIAACKGLRNTRTLRIVCIVICGIAGLACAVYIGLTALFLDAIQHQPPA